MRTAEQIYDEAISRARRDHRAMVQDFIDGKIAIASPPGMDRERQYVIEAFAAILHEDQHHGR